MDERISVAQVLELGVSITWQQAVAVTLDAWHAALNAHVREQPVQLDAESCLLTVKGHVLLPRPAAVHRPDGAMQLLRAMLDGVDAPAELVEVAFGTATDTLSDDLAQFSRPNRRVEIADVATRGLAARAALAIHAPVAPTTPAWVAPPLASAALPPDGAFAALRQEAAARTPNVPAKASATQARRPMRWWVPVLVGTTATIAIVAAWQWWPGAPAVPAGAAAIAETPLEESPPDPAWFAAGQRTADIHLTRRPAATTLATSSAAVAELSAEVNTGGPTVVERSSAPTPGATSSSPARGGPDGVMDGDVDVAETPIYSWTSEGVSPPTMVLPRMPAAAFPEPGDDLNDRPYLEVLVNEQGSVDAVRLRGNLRSSDVVRHGMMMAPAKAWQFAPATRNGQPVRYVVRVLVNQ